jgi:murein DD-endopeptidase MepM/ murein hydrolase activator NlpD
MAPTAQAGLLDDLKSKISDRTDQIRQLDLEINLFRTQLTKTQTEKQSLQSELNTLESTDKQLHGELKKTETNLKKTDQSIVQIVSEISTKQEDIIERRAAILEALRIMREADEQNLLEVMSSENSLSDFLSSTQAIDTVQKTLYRDIDLLRHDTRTLAEKKRDEEAAKDRLAKLKAEIDDRKQLVAQNKSTKAQLLSVTKSQETLYQVQLADRLAKKQQVEAELHTIEEQMKVTINPSSLPQSGSKTLLWPLDKVVLTQSFGHTEFSKTASVYNGKGHNGIDLGTPTGTPLKAASAGVVKGIGDTDVTCRGASYGKWILIEHGNGLSTLYAHLSLIKVAEGQSVAAGELIGYTGNTGYSTGPHLHFTLYASQAVQIGSLQSKVPGCGTYRLPIAAYNGYLNPLAYLP